MIHNSKISLVIDPEIEIGDIKLYRHRFNDDRAIITDTLFYVTEVPEPYGGLPKFLVKIEIKAADYAAGKSISLNFSYYHEGTEINRDDFIAKCKQDAPKSEMGLVEPAAKTNQEPIALEAIAQRIIGAMHQFGATENIEASCNGTVDISIVYKKRILLLVFTGDDPHKVLTEDRRNQLLNAYHSSYPAGVNIIAIGETYTNDMTMENFMSCDGIKKVARDLVDGNGFITRPRL